VLVEVELIEAALVEGALVVEAARHSVQGASTPPSRRAPRESRSARRGQARDVAAGELLELRTVAAAEL